MEANLGGVKGAGQGVAATGCRWSLKAALRYGGPDAPMPKPVQERPKSEARSPLAGIAGTKGAETEPRNTRNTRKAKRKELGFARIARIPRFRN